MKIDSELNLTIKTLKEVLDSMQIDSCLIGAMVPYIEIAVKLGIASRETRDVDCVANIDSWERFEEVISALEQRGFSRTKSVHRMTFGTSSIVDIIPIGKEIAPEGLLKWPRDGNIMHVGGFDRIFTDTKEEPVFGDTKWRIATIPIFVVSKILAYEDRRLNKDLSDIKFCLEHYKEGEGEEERYDIMERTPKLEWTFAGAYLLGVHAGGYVDDNISTIVNDFVVRFGSYELPIIDMIIRESGRAFIDDNMRRDVFELMNWFILGLKRDH